MVVNEELNSKIAVIKDILIHNVLGGAALLMDLVREYSVHENLEDEVILLKIQYEKANAVTQTEIQNKLIEITDNIRRSYDPDAIRRQNEKEERLIKQMEIKAEKSTVVLRIVNIEKHFSNTSFNLKLDHLELRLGDITGILGENATGKTSLFRILAGELANDQGELFYPLFQKNKLLNWVNLKKHIAYVPQELPRWVGSLENNLRFEAAIRGKTRDKNDKAFKYIIQRLRLASHQDKTWRQLSGGYKLRFSLAKALIWEPKLLLLDEPLANLDINTQLLVLSDLKALAKSLRRPMAILISSQHIHELESIVDQMLFMKEGTVENLGKLASFRVDRTQNVFEVESSLSYSKLFNQLQGFRYDKIANNGIAYLIFTPLDISEKELLDYFLKNKIPIKYFRNISQSVKTRFYETNTE